MNYKMMGKFLSQILIVEAGFMVPALLISLYTGSRAAVYGFGLSILITAGVGALMYYFCRNSTRRFFAREGMVCVAGSWIAISFFGCLPFVFSREIPNFVDALFEIVSGFTTTGSSILGDVEALSPGIMYWRSFSHWLGGMGVLVFLLALSPNGERGKGYTMHLLRAESPGPNVNKLVPKMRTTARILYVIYMVLTFINFLFLLLGKMPVFDAVCTAFGTAGTGGFGIQNDSIAGYSPYIQNVCTVFMFLFGINFSCYYLLLVRHVKEVLKDQELRLYIIIFVVSILLITFNVRGLYGSWEETIRHAAFQVSSIMTTTGILVSKYLYHDDVRTHGSGAAGMTNMLRTFGKKAAALTAVGDVLKGVVAVCLGRWLFGHLPADAAVSPYLGVYLAAILAVVGHSKPIYFGFKGGKGVLVAAGAILAVQPVLLPVLAVIFLVCLVPTGMVSLGSITMAAAYPVLTLVYSLMRGLPTRDVVVCTVGAAIMGGMVIWMHRSNIQRIRDGKEYRFGQKHKSN